MLEIIDDRMTITGFFIENATVGIYFKHEGLLYRMLRVSSTWKRGEPIRVLEVESGEITTIASSTRIVPIEAKLHLVEDKKDD